MRRSVSSILLASVLLFASAGGAKAGPAQLDWHGSPSAIAAGCASQLQTLQQRTARIAAPQTPRTFAATTLELENAVADARDALAPTTALAAAASDRQVREAAMECQTDFDDTLAQISSDAKLLKAIATSSHRTKPANAYDAKLSALWIQRLQRSGAMMTPARRAESLRLQTELTSIEGRIQQRRSDSAVAITLGRRETNALPPDLLATCERHRDGSYTIPVNESTRWLLEYAQSEDVRHRYWLAGAREAEAVIPLLQRAIAVEDRLSHLYGYESWSDYRTARTTGVTTARLESFMRTIDGALQPAADRDERSMVAALAADANAAPSLNAWDVQRAEELQRERQSAGDDELRRYFPAQHTVDATLDVYHSLFDVAFERVEPAQAWAPDVLEYLVRDASTNASLGTLYIDLYARQGKSADRRFVSILPARTIGSVRRPPVAAILLNWPAPAAGSQYLLSHADLVTLFRETSRGMAAMFAMAPYETLDGVREDLAEASSQTFENYAWQPQVLKRLSSDAKTGAALSDDLIANLAATRSLDEAYDTSRVLELAARDLQAHESGPRVPLERVAGGDPASLFSFISESDNAAYAAPWAQMYADDLFTAFSGSPDGDATVAQKFRQQILAPARTYDPDAEVARFLGRATKPDAFFRQLGLPQAETHE